MTYPDVAKAILWKDGLIGSYPKTTSNHVNIRTTQCLRALMYVFIFTYIDKHRQGQKCSAHIETFVVRRLTMTGPSTP